MNSIRLHSAVPAPRRAPFRAAVRAALLAAAIVALSGCSTVKGWFDMDKSGAKAASKPLELTQLVLFAAAKPTIGRRPPVGEQ